MYFQYLETRNVDVKLEFRCKTRIQKNGLPNFTIDQAQRDNVG